MEKFGPKQHDAHVQDRKSAQADVAGIEEVEQREFKARMAQFTSEIKNIARIGLPEREPEEKRLAQKYRDFLRDAWELETRHLSQVSGERPTTFADWVERELRNSVEHAREIPAGVGYQYANKHEKESQRRALPTNETIMGVFNQVRRMAHAGQGLTLRREGKNMADMINRMEPPSPDKLSEH